MLYSTLLFFVVLLQLTLDEDVELDAQSEQWLVVNVSCDAKRWTVRRTYESLYMLDKQLHRCIYDRKFSMLPELTKDLIEEAGAVVSGHHIHFQFQCE